MAKIDGPLYSIKAGGKFADKVIFLDCPEGTFVQRTYPGNVPDTENQWKNQAAISITNELYSLPEKADWQAWENRVGKDPLTGNNLFTSLANKAHHREVSFNVISAVTLSRIAKNSESTSYSFSSDLNSSSPSSCSDLNTTPHKSFLHLNSSSPNSLSGLNSTFLNSTSHSSSPDISSSYTDLSSLNNSVTAILKFKCRYDSLILISIWPKGSPPLSLPDHLPLPKTAESGQPIQLSPGYLLIPFQARGWDNLATRRLDWNSWDWESWNQAKEKCNPLKIVTDSSSQGPLNQIEITSSGLQPDRQYFCRLTELPRLLPGPPDLTATIINVNPSAASSGTLDKNSPSGTLDALNTSDKDDPTGTLAKQAKVSPSDTLNKVDKDSPSVILNKDSKYSSSDTLNKVAKDSSSDTLNKGTKYSPSGTLNIDTEDAPQDYLTRARIALDSAPAALVYAVTCCLPGSEDDSISYVISQDSPVSLSPGTYLNLSWQAMPEASCYNIYRTFSSAGLPCGFLGQTTSNSYQDQGQVIQNFSLPPEIKPSYLIDGDSGYYLFST